MSTKINCNGQISDNLSISFYDHGFLFGDSVYEVIATSNNVPCFLNEHIDRLQGSAAGIFLDIPFDRNRLIQEVERTLQAAGNEESYIRIIVTRGEGDVNIDPSSCHKPNVIIYVTQEKKYPAENYVTGVNLAVVSVKRNSSDSLNPSMKTGNYLNNILAIMEANRSGAHDAIMLNAAGCITESTTSNIFFCSDGTLFTPALNCGILEGITRRVIMRIAEENDMPVEEGRWPVEAMISADEIFITGTIKRVMPVTQIDGKMIGSGKPGSISLKMARLYDQHLESHARLYPS
ncbi:MAG: branched-chain-amino acid aminotransferase [Candidatus Nitrohelix vancouverensis]|uniref:branched-chain-amino-acid transaminase n=1 Tax=Candidatus Nitrohelix vancouverensis TaxID=2705534 RepID=A0A7T0G3Z8_9BACT|nr:MAG: branched-chain-amino acid aminotransferase [Candidatus Nitrohelix vancouverensis]